MPSAVAAVSDVLRTCAYWEDRLAAAQRIDIALLGVFSLDALDNSLPFTATGRMHELRNEIRSRVASTHTTLEELSQHRVLGPVFCNGFEELDRSIDELQRLAAGKEVEVQWNRRTGLRWSVPGAQEVPKLVRPGGTTELHVTSHFYESDWQDPDSEERHTLSVPPEGRRAAQNAAVEFQAVRTLFESGEGDGPIQALVDEYAVRLLADVDAAEQARSQLIDLINERLEVSGCVAELIETLT